MKRGGAADARPAVGRARIQEPGDDGERVHAAVPEAVHESRGGREDESLAVLHDRSLLDWRGQRSFGAAARIAAHDRFVCRNSGSHLREGRLAGRVAERALLRERDRLTGREERVRGRDDLVTGTDAECLHRDDQRGLFWNNPYPAPGQAQDNPGVTFEGNYPHVVRDVLPK